MAEETWPTVCVDLDGVLAEYHGWRGAAHIGLPLPGAAEFTRMLHERRCYVVIHTAREDVVPVMRWCAEHGVYYDEVSRVKVPAIAYVDDRAVRFTGDFERVYQGILAPPWWGEEQL